MCEVALLGGSQRRKRQKNRPGFGSFLMIVDRFTEGDRSTAQERAETGTTVSIEWGISLAMDHNEARCVTCALRQDGRGE